MKARQGSAPILDIKLPTFKLDIPLPKSNDELPIGPACVYRTPAEVEDEPCGSCVRDVTKPHQRVGYADPDAPMMLRCDVCGDRWIDPVFARQIKESEEKLQEMLRQNGTFQKMVDRMLEDALAAKKPWPTRTAIATGACIAVIVERIFHIFFP